MLLLIVIIIFAVDIVDQQDESKTRVTRLYAFSQIKSQKRTPESCGQDSTIFCQISVFLVFSPNVGVLRGKCNMLLLIVITIFAFDIVDQ